ncbi:YbgA family protein [Paraglaciecola aquimarina]|uniref:YbgA family protein n=1 Tax=Paraglaciecola aquimarina TaxID=1235557 RepID=A0ABU3SWL9_9ALTE|nr:YbgA family protein [Paraglaciecola aquimarina]MDU0354399.1 YbgA family protein [Paraglaciecola aquimarina]
MERVKVYRKNAADRIGVGIYANKLMENFPHLPIEEEGRLLDAKLRENFIQRVYIYKRWQEMVSQGNSLKELQKFHAQHKYILMSHDQKQVKNLGGLLAQSQNLSISQLTEIYLEKMMATLKKIATRENHANTLQHIQGYLKNDIDKDDKAELCSTFTDYKNGLLPLIVPITLLRHHFRKHPNDYITQSYYMSPYPGELMLLNHI